MHPKSTIIVILLLITSVILMIIIKTFRAPHLIWAGSASQQYCDMSQHVKVYPITAQWQTTKITDDTKWGWIGGEEERATIFFFFFSHLIPKLRRHVWQTG